MATKPGEDILLIRRPPRDYLGVSDERRKLERATRDAEGMPLRELEKRCARVAAKAGKFLVSARAIIEPELPYFLALRQRLNAQGRHGGVEGWQRWCEKHFSCDVRTVNRALSAILGPEKERKKSRKWRAPAEALLEAVDPAIRLARRHADTDPDAAEFLSRLEVEDLDGLISEPEVRSESPLDKLNRERQVKKDELYEMGLHLARAVMEGASAVNGDIPDGKKIIGLAKHMLEIKKAAGELTVYQIGPQDKLSRSPGTNFVVDEDDLNTAMVVAKKVEGDSKVKPHMFSISRVGGYEITPSGETAWLRPGGLAGLDAETLGDPHGKKGGWAFKINSITLSVDYERIALNMWMIPHNEAAKEECGIYYDKQPHAKHILGDGGPLCMPRGTRAYGFSKNDYEYVKGGDKVAVGGGLCYECWWRNLGVIAEHREIVREAIGVIETTDKQRADDFVAAMRGLIDSFTKKAKKPGSEKAPNVRKASGSA